ncbi:MAG: hypothetical protein KJO29_05305 [Bacteroidia bacterium]|nr:hypothetical protein [Bacteroidia bacterium]
MFLKEIPGHEPVKSYLKKIVSEDRVPHAFLFVGAEGHGKLSLALGFAALLQCENRVDNEACGQCRSCQKMIKNVHPDLHFAYPVISKDGFKREDTISKHFIGEWRIFLENNPWGSLHDWMLELNAVDKQANINVTECNSIIKNLGLKSFEGKYKIQIIWMAEFLGKESNRLLKLIEEPSPDTIIILIANQENLILNTIRSRCQIVSLPPFKDEDIRTYISDTFELKEEDIQELCYLANGNIRKARQLGDSSEAQYFEEMLKWFRLAYSGDPEGIDEFVNLITSKGKQYLFNFLNYCLHFLREYYLGLHTRSTDGLRLSNAEKNTLMQMQKIINGEQTARLERLLGSSISYIKRNLSLRILFMHLTLEINTILKSEAKSLIT